MTLLSLAFALAPVILGQADAADPERVANALYRAVLAEGLAVEGVTVKLPAPCLRDGMSDAARRTALMAVVDLPLDEFLRDSVNAPFKLKVSDAAYPGGVVRVIALWFAIHADLGEIDLDDLAGKQKRAGQGEVGNMSFSARTLSDAELESHSKEIREGLDRYAVSRGVLLDRVEVATTNHIVAAKSAGSLVVASRTDHSFDKDATLSNRWVPLPGPGEAKKAPVLPRPYPGTAGYTKIAPLSERPSILLVESHLAFVEPKAWFNGSSILRAKISLIAQDQIRQLRREVAARRKKGVKASSSTP